MKARSSKVGDRSRILEQQICPKMQISMSPNNPSDSWMVLSGVSLKMSMLSAILLINSE